MRIDNLMWKFARMRVVITITLVCLLSACGGNPIWLPRAHKITVQQGNLINQTQLDQITVGMDREQVRTLIGSPVVDTPFQSDRWEYIYTSAPAGTAVEASRVYILFADERVTSIDSNQNSVSGTVPPQRYFWEPKGNARISDF